MREGWREVNLGDVLEIQNGYAFNSKQFSGVDGVPLIRIRDLKDGSQTKTRYTGEYDQKYIVRSGDLLIGMDGEFSCFAWQGADALLNQRVCRLEKFSSSLLPKYLFYGVNKYLKEIEDVTGFTTVKHISAKQIKGIRFPLPPLSEQKRIVAILDEAFAGIDAAIANTEKNLANARELFESYLNSIFTKKGDGWVAKNLSECCDIKHGLAFKGSDFTVSNDTSKPIVLTPGNYSEDGDLYFTEKNTKRFTGDVPKDYLFDVGDLTVVMTDLSSKMKILGKPAFINQPNILHNQRIGRLVFREPCAVSKFYYYFLRTRAALEKIKETSTGTMVRHTAPKRILALRIPMPPTTKEQADIVVRLDEISGFSSQLANMYTAKRNCLADLKQSLLKKMFSGELTAESDAALKVAVA